MLPEPAATIGRERRGMYRLQHQILCLVYHVRLRASIATPQHIDYMFARRSQCTDGSICEGLPPQRRMAVSLVGTYRQRRVKQQHTLLCPSCQVSALRNRRSQVLLYLLENVLQRGWELHAVLYRKTQPMGLSWLVIRVLSDDYHLYLIERTQVESIEYQGTWRITCPCRIFLPDSTC